MTVRRAVPEDAAACARIVHGWVTHTQWMPDDVPTLPDFIEMFQNGMPLREMWVSGDPVAAYLSLEAEVALVHGLYSAQPGAGHGKQLLDRVKTGRDRVQLWTHEPNVRAQAFYRREGFEVMERKAEGRGDGVPELRMEWRQ